MTLGFEFNSRYYVLLQSISQCGIFHRPVYTEPGHETDLGMMTAAKQHWIKV